MLTTIAINELKLDADTVSMSSHQYNPYYPNQNIVSQPAYMIWVIAKSNIVNRKYTARVGQYTCATRTDRGCLCVACTVSIRSGSFIAHFACVLCVHLICIYKHPKCIWVWNCVCMCVRVRKCARE